MTNNPEDPADRRCAIITGAARGFGRALTSAFHAAGWHVIPIVRNPADVEALSNVFREHCSPISADITTSSVSEQIPLAIAAAGGGLSVLINNAGIPSHGATIDAIDLDDIGLLLATHCTGALRLAKICAPFLRKQPDAWIVNVSSRLGSLQRNSLGEFGREGHSYAYRIAKAALNMATLCLAHDESLAGVRVIAIHPGRMRTLLGGDDAPHTAGESAAILLRRVRMGEFQSGRFYDLYGGEIPW